METIRFLQSFENPFTTYFFKSITFLGGEVFFLVIIPILFWVYKKRVARDAMILLLTSLFVAVLIKYLTQLPRPAGVALVEAGGTSFPSGHAMGAAVFWGYLAYAVRKMWFSVISILLIVLICLSRLYLGVHWPRDVIGGLVMGLILLYLFVATQNKAEKLYVFLQSGAGLPIFFIATVAASIIFPHEHMVTLMGLAFGVACGLFAESRFWVVENGGTKFMSFVKIVLGTLVTLALWKGLWKIFPEGLIFSYIIYMIVGFWMFGGSCLLFQKITPSRS